MVSHIESITLLGSTGSIGQQTLNIIKQHEDRYRVEALVAHQNVECLYQQCILFQPRVAVLANEACAKQLATRLKATNLKTEVLAGSQAVIDVAADSASNIVMAGIVGAAGLPATFAAVKQGKKILLANKESLVMAGQLFMDAVRQHNATLLPVDSEHNAIFQCMTQDFLPGQPCPTTIESIILTASGGPFYQTPVAEFATITPAQAVKHPNWSMGQKISVDSATMMNKGLELIEGHWLFAMPAEKIEVIVHPESIIHSMVRYVDGSVLAQMGNPDMRTPIANALAWPNRIKAEVAPLDLLKLKQLNFAVPDTKRFPCLQLAVDALLAGGGAPVVLNAANELAVAEFLDQRIKFNQIPIMIREHLEHHVYTQINNLDDILALDTCVRSLKLTL